MKKTSIAFRSYYDQFRAYPPLRPTEERRLLHVIKGLQPPVDYDGMTRMWGKHKENGTKAAIDDLWLSPMEKMWGRDVEVDFPVNGTCRLPTPAEQEEAIQRFVMHNMRLVLSRVLKFRHQEDRDVMEIVSYGTDGLYRAIELFDLTRGTRFSTYAVHWIESQIRKGLTFVEGQKPPRLKKLTSSFKKAEKELTTEAGVRPTSEDVAKRLNWGTKTLHVFQTSGISNVPIETFDAEDDACGPILEDVAKRELVKALHDNMGILEPFEEDIIRRHYGLGYPEETLQRLANVYGVTKERIRQIENGGLHKLYMELRHFRDHDD
jgi:RNA polymerase primary sigma factor